MCKREDSNSNPPFLIRLVSKIILIQPQKVLQIKKLEECVEDLFSQFIIELEKRNEIEFENLFVDGTKIEANANRYSFVWKKATDKFEEKLQNKTHKILLNISSELDLNLSIPDEKISVEYALAIKDKLIEIKEKEGLDFVYGKGKRKSSVMIGF